MAFNSFSKGFSGSSSVFRYFLMVLNRFFKLMSVVGAFLVFFVEWAVVGVLMLLQLGF